MELNFSGAVLPACVHFVSFFLLGALIAAAHERWLTRWRFDRVALLAFGACTVLETAKLLISARHAHIADLALNVSGLLLGLWISTRWQNGRSWRLTLKEHLRRNPFRMEVVCWP